MSQPDRNPGRPVPRRLRQVGGAFVLLAIAVVAYGLGSRAAQNSRLHDLTEAQAVPTVAIVAPTQRRRIMRAWTCPGAWKPTSVRPSTRASRGT